MFCRYKGLKDFKSSKVSFKSKNLKEKSKQLNFTRKHKKPVHTLFDDDGEPMEVKPSKALARAKKFLEAIEATSEEGQTEQANQVRLRGFTTNVEQPDIFVTGGKISSRQFL